MSDDSQVINAPRLAGERKPRHAKTKETHEVSMQRKCCETLTESDERHDRDLDTVADKNREKHAFLGRSKHVAMDPRSTREYVAHSPQD